MSISERLRGGVSQCLRPNNIDAPKALETICLLSCTKHIYSSFLFSKVVVLNFTRPLSKQKGAAIAIVGRKKLNLPFMMRFDSSTNCMPFLWETINTKKSQSYRHFWYGVPIAFGGVFPHYKDNYNYK